MFAAGCGKSDSVSKVTFLLVVQGVDGIVPMFLPVALKYPLPKLFLRPLGWDGVLPWSRNSLSNDRKPHQVAGNPRRRNADLPWVPSARIRESCSSDIFAFFYPPWVCSAHLPSDSSHLHVPQDGRENQTGRESCEGIFSLLKVLTGRPCNTLSVSHGIGVIPL